MILVANEVCSISARIPHPQGPVSASLTARSLTHPHAQPPMQIFVKTLTGKTITLEARTAHPGRPRPRASPRPARPTPPYPTAEPPAVEVVVVVIE